MNKPYFESEMTTPKDTKYHIVLREEKIQIEKEVDIYLARKAGNSVLEPLPFTTIQTHAILTCISELATNIFIYAKTGTIILKYIQNEGDRLGIEIVAQDHGPGIPNIEKAMMDGYSTGNSLGYGLPGVNRLMSEMFIFSKPNLGTRIVARKWIHDALSNQTYHIASDYNYVGVSSSHQKPSALINETISKNQGVAYAARQTA